MQQAPSPISPMHRRSCLRNHGALLLTTFSPTLHSSLCELRPDHGLLAICLHANGANVIAGDRAASPLNVARENARLYLRHAQQAPFSVLATAAAERGAPAGKSEYTGTPDPTAETLPQPINEGSSGEGVGNEGAVADGVVPRLECRLGDGLAVLEQGGADTVCIAGVGAYLVWVCV